MKDTSKLLPIGSVVLLNNGTKKVMVTGFYTVPANDNTKVFDYCGCLFPEGIITSEQNLLFDHNQIQTVCYMGYANEEDKEFKAKLAELINKEAPTAAPTAAPVETPQVNAAPVANPQVSETPVSNAPIEENTFVANN